MNDAIFAMEFQMSFEIGASSAILVRKQAKADPPAINANLCLVFSVARVEGISLPYSVLLVLRCIGLPKIRESVVRSVPIDVVNEDGRPNTMYIEPCQPMGLVVLAADADRSVPTWVATAGHCARPTLIPEIAQPAKLASGWAIAHGLSEHISGQFTRHGDTNCKSAEWL